MFSQLKKRIMNMGCSLFRIEMDCILSDTTLASWHPWRQWKDTMEYAEEDFRKFIGEVTSELKKTFPYVELYHDADGEHDILMAVLQGRTDAIRFAVKGNLHQDDAGLREVADSLKVTYEEV